MIIVCLDNGKVAVEINQQDISQCSLDELSEDGIVQVNYMEEMPHSESDDEREGQYGIPKTSAQVIERDEDLIRR